MKIALLLLLVISWNRGLYEELIFDNYDSPGRSTFSKVLPYKNPKFYIHTGGPMGCPHRLSQDLILMWKAIIPVVASQLTGKHYKENVTHGCEPKERQYGWVIISYVFPSEYERETDRIWGKLTEARATVGSTYGRIWIRYNGKLAHPQFHTSEMIAHELGHAFGLYHTRSNFIMSAGERFNTPFKLFTPEEQKVARQAYKMGRGSICDTCPGQDYKSNNYILPN